MVGPHAKAQSSPRNTTSGITPSRKARKEGLIKKCYWPSANGSYFKFWIYPNQKLKQYAGQFLASLRLCVRKFLLAQGQCRSFSEFSAGKYGKPDAVSVHISDHLRPMIAIKLVSC